MIEIQKTISPQVFQTLVCQHHDFIRRQLQTLNTLLRADVLYIASIDADLSHATSLIALEKEQSTENFRFPLTHSPSGEVVSQQACIVDQGITRRFPNDTSLAKLKIEGYLGMRIVDSSGNILGIVAGLFKTPQQNLARHHYALTMSVSYIAEFMEKTFYSDKLSEQLDLLSKVEEISQTGAWELQASNRALSWSEQTYRIHGLDPSESISVEQAILFYTEDSRAEITQLVEEALHSGRAYQTELSITDAQGQQKRIRTSGAAEIDCHGKVVRLYGAIEDISQEYALLTDLTYQNARINSILNNLNDAVITVNGDGRIDHVNDVACNMFGYQENQLLSAPVSMLMPEPYASKHSDFMAHYEKTGEARIIGTGRQLPGLRQNGEIFQMELSLTKSLYNGQAEYIGIIRDITERLKAEDTIYNLAYTDDITGLKNKRWFQKELKDLLVRAKAKGEFICAALIDIDKMAQFNLKYGFKSGNLAIAQIAQNLLAKCDDKTRIYKNGADSFVLLSLETKPREQAENLEDCWLHDAFWRHHNFQVDCVDHNITLSASVGSCICDASSHTFESVFDTLEHTLRRAKLKSPFGYYFIDEAGICAYERIKNIRSELESVIENGELRIVLQPQYQNSNTIKSSEALVRWHSKQLGFVSPAEFIPLAEETDAIIGIGDWVLEQVCRLLQQMNKAGQHTRIAVNISSKQIVLPDFASKLVNLTTRYQVSPQQIMLELTETALVADIELVKNVMLTMKEQGFIFSIDDFGTGYSSLNYLKELPISELKIDKHFVDDIAVDTQKPGGKIVNLIIDMAKILDVDCVAEGVETAEQVSFLSARQCALFQGYYFAKPLEIPDWLDLMTESRAQTHEDYVI